MNKTKQILYSLLMAIVMMAMSPMRVWAQEADPRMAVFTELNGVTATFKDGNYPWGLTEHEGFDALTSTNQGENETTSETTIKLNCEQCIMLSFNYAVSCEEDFDLLTIVVDGETVVEGISGTESGVYEKLLDANGNGHTITMRYKKDDSAEDNDDCGYIYNIMAVADAHQHQFNDDYVCTLCGFRSRLAVFTKLEGVTATFEDEGDYPWGLTKYNGLDALMSTNQGKDGTTSTTTIKLACDQAIELQFSYKTSSEGIADYLIISVDGNEVVNSQYAERGEDGITTVVSDYASLLPANANGHTITMSYIKDNSSSSGDDCGYIYFISAYTHQHYYNATSCDWSEDNTSATLHLECECGETADVEATTITRTEEAPTCVKDGFCTITASAAYNGKTVKDSKTETFAALGHDWQVQSDGTYACQREGCTAQSATFPIEVIESSGGFEGEGPENLFDGDPNTKWCGSDVENESNSFYVIFKPSKPSVLVSYSLVDAEDTQDYYNRGWSSWDIQGTNDPNLALWESISSENGDYQGSTFTTGNTTAYTYYMITFSVDCSEDGKNYLQQMADMNITWCTEHQWGEDHKCSVCGYECQHQDWEYGECTICGYECKHKDSDENDYCDICGIHAQTFASIQELIDAGQDYDAVNVNIDGEVMMAMPNPDNPSVYYVVLSYGNDGYIQLKAPTPDPALNWPSGGRVTGTLKYADWNETDKMLYSKDADFWSALNYTEPDLENIPTYSSIADLLADENLAIGTNVTVTVSGTIAMAEYVSEINAYQIMLDNGFAIGAMGCVTSDPGWAVGGTVSGTLQNVTFIRNSEEGEEVVGVMSMTTNIFAPGAGLEYTAPAGGSECEHDFTSKTLTAEPDEHGLYAYACDREGCEGHSDYNVVKGNGEGNNIELIATTDSETGITTYSAESVIIEDGKPFYSPVEFTTRDVDMGRQFTQSIGDAVVPATIMLPFRMEAGEVSTVNPQGVRIGTKFYSFTSLDYNSANDRWEANMDIVIDDLEAYTPYMVVLTDGEEIPFGNAPVTFTQTPAEMNNITSSDGEWSFVATNEAKVWTAADFGHGEAYYGFAAGNETTPEGKFVKVGTGASIDPLRAYIMKNVQTRGSASNAPSRALTASQLPSTIGVRLNETYATGIGTLNTETGEFTFDGWYDLQGRRISEPVKNGISIKNDKKILVK